VAAPGEQFQAGAGRAFVRRFIEDAAAAADDGVSRKDERAGMGQRGGLCFGEREAAGEFARGFRRPRGFVDGGGRDEVGRAADLFQQREAARRSGGEDEFGGGGDGACPWWWMGSGRLLEGEFIHTKPLTPALSHTWERESRPARAPGFRFFVMLGACPASRVAG
jgi:hypothetical protein